MTNLDGILKSDITLPTKVHLVKAMVFPVVMLGCQSWTTKTVERWCHRTVVLVKTLENPLDSKEIRPVNPKGNQLWLFIERSDAEAEVPINTLATWCEEQSWLFETPWTAIRQTSLSITNSWSLLKLVSIELVMPSNHLIFCRPLLLLALVFLSKWVSSSNQVAKVLEFQL